MLQQCVGDTLRPVAKRRIADEQCFAASIIADARLQMRETGIGRRQGKGYAAVDQSAGTVPSDGELAAGPAVLLSPGAFAVVRGAVVANGGGYLLMINRHFPEPAQRRQGGRRAGLMMLTDETNFKQDGRRKALRPSHSLRQFLGNLVVERGFGLPREVNGGSVIAAVIGGVRTTSCQPFGQTFFQERRQLGEACVAALGVVIMAQLSLQDGQL